MFGCFLPSLLVGLAPPTLLGNRSRHCHGINYTQNPAVPWLRTHRRRVWSFKVAMARRLAISSYQARRIGGRQTGLPSQHCVRECGRPRKQSRANCSRGLSKASFGALDVSVATPPCLQIITILAFPSSLTGCARRAPGNSLAA